MDLLYRFDLHFIAGVGLCIQVAQTLASWFLLQMYTTKAPPTHQQIQQALVDVGDKQPSLIGSKEWIGSFEVSACLSHLLGVCLPLPLSLTHIQIYM